jgi:sulfide:quinone oxidoreductase
MPSTAHVPFRVAIAGGGIAAVSALMALADLGERRLDVELINPGADFVLRPQLVGEPWGGPPLHVPLHELTAELGARHRFGTLERVDADTGTVTTTDGRVEQYDAVLVATGAVSGIAYAGVWTIGFGALPEALSHASRGSVAVVVPPGTGWPLPAYELALLTAAAGDAPVSVITPERRALDLFGPDATDAVAAFLARHGVGVVLGASVPPGSAHDLADHVVSLPVLHGPRIAGLPTLEDGFLPVDERQRVTGTSRVYAAGDATAARIKQGGLAAYQAETAAVAIVRAAGMSPPPHRETPRLRGKLAAAGGEELYLRRTLDGEDRGRADDQPLWRPQAAMLAWRLSRWLTMREPADIDPLGHLARPADATSSAP